jgi:hypothetical protein
LYFQPYPFMTQIAPAANGVIIPYTSRVVLRTVERTLWSAARDIATWTSFRNLADYRDELSFVCGRTVNALGPGLTAACSVCKVCNPLFNPAKEYEPLVLARRVTDQEEVGHIIDEYLEHDHQAAIWEILGYVAGRDSIVDPAIGYARFPNEFCLEVNHSLYGTPYLFRCGTCAHCIPDADFTASSSARPPFQIQFYKKDLQLTQPEAVAPLPDSAQPTASSASFVDPTGFDSEPEVSSRSKI